ncbi:MAG TPA: ABC transporter ATP-binding protein [Thermoplasmata archaeon]|nr:ABC transporter ATP-binding protein [Thermoplasmata archaeon]
MIVAEKLTKRFGDLVAVNNIDLHIEEAECFGFLGPNGAGKTTTMKMIQCVSPMTSGKLTVAGIDVNEEPRKIKAMLGVAPQNENLDPDFTVEHNLLAYSRYFDIPKEVAKERTEKLLDFFQLQAKKDVAIDKLSGGMKKRLILARALINEPKILILDEPTVGLDPQARHLIWDQLGRLKSRGITILLTTHYMEEAAQLCDRLVIMDNGKILAEGNPTELVEKNLPGNVIETSNSPQVVACLKNGVGDGSYDVAGDTIHVFTDQPKEILSKLMSECKIEQASVRETTLEDLFLKLTGRTLRE